MGHICLVPGFSRSKSPHLATRRDSGGVGRFTIQSKLCSRRVDVTTVDRRLGSPPAYSGKERVGTDQIEKERVRVPFPEQIVRQQAGLCLILDFEDEDDSFVTLCLLRLHCVR